MASSLRGKLKDSPLAEALVLRWADGNLSALDVQDIAACAVASGATDGQVHYLASLGSAGSSMGGNASKQLYQRYCKDIGICEPTVIRAPHKNVKTGEVIEADTAIQLPHDLVSSLAAGYPAVVLEDFFGISKVEAWWESQSHRNPKFWQHPMLDMNYHQMCIPVMLHGDAAEFQDRDSLNTMSLKGVLMNQDGGQGGHLALASVPKSCTTPGTWELIWRWLAWSFQALLSGMHPAIDPFGVKWPRGSKRAALAGSNILPNGLRCVLWSFCGDLAFYSSDLGQPYHNSNEFCWRCMQDRSLTPWNDFRPRAAWRATVLSGAELADTAQRHTLFNSGLGFGLAMLMFDSMHVLDLGVTLYTLGSVLYEITYRDMAEPNKQECFNILWVRMQEISRELGQEQFITRLTLRQLKDPAFDAYPCLKFIKAAEARHLSRVVAALAREYNRGTQEHAHRDYVMTSLTNIYDQIETRGFQLADPSLLSKAIDTFLVHYSALARISMERGEFNWSITPKFHFLCHLAEQAHFEHPRLYWNYSGETYVGHVSRVAHMCVFGKPVHTIAPKLFSRIRIGLHLRLAKEYL